MIVFFKKIFVYSGFPGRYWNIFLLAGVFSYLVSYAVVAAEPPTSKSPALEHRAAVAEARQGQYDSALRSLSALVKDYPSRLVFLHDYISVLSWAGRDEEVLAQLPRIDLERTPSYVLNAIGKSARNLQRPDLAIKLYRAALKQDTDKRQARLGLALSLAEADQPIKAREQMNILLKDAPNSVELLEALAYVKQMDRDYAGAITVYERLLAKNPNHRGARRGRILNMIRLGATHEAARLARDESTLFNTEEQEQIAANKAATVVRWGRLPVVDPAIRHHDNDRAIELLQDQYTQIQDKRSLSAQRNRFDLISAYRNRRYMNDAVAVYEQLRGQGVKKFPPYVQAAVGEAYLSLHQPEQAIILLERAVKEYPDNLDAQYALYYAYLEAGHYEKSLAHIDALAASLPEKEWPPGGNEWEWSADKLYAQTVAAQARAYVGKLDEAERELRSLLAQAPADPDVRNALGGVALWRGWPRQALTEHEIVLAQDPENLGARLGVARVMFARNNVVGADSALKSLSLHYSDDPHVQDLLREAEVSKKREVWLGINGGSNSSLYQGSNELTIETYYYDEPYRPGLRPFVFLLHSEADFSGVTAVRNRLAAGLHYRKQDMVLRGSISEGDGSLGISLRGNRAFTDHLSGFLSMDSFSNQTPLQAELLGVEAWSFSGGTEYRFNESRRLGISTQYMDFDDGNRRQTFTAFGRQRLINNMRYKLEGELTTYRQTNTKDNLSYFNPSRQTTIELGLNNQWQTWRRYEKSMHQRLLFNIGTSHQQGFGMEFIWSVAYEHHWQFSRQLSLSYGLSRARPTYDGNQEYATRGFLNLYTRF